MVDPTKLPGEHDVFICGEDSDAKAQVAGVLREFGGPSDHIVDLGGISAARGTELYVALWLNLWGVWERGSSTSRSCVRGASASTRQSPATRPQPDKHVHGGGVGVNA